MPTPITKTISLRLPVQLVEELERRGAPEHCSAGEVARRYVNERLSEGEQSDAMAAIEKLNQLLRDRFLELEQKLQVAVMTLLVDAGKASVDEAEQWVDENLR